VNGEPRKFFDPHQPQTLQIGVMLLYINAVFKVLYGAVFHPIGLALVAGLAAGGYGIANEKKWGYQVGVASAAVNLALPLLIAGADLVLDSAFGLLSLLFDVALVALLLHPHSRDYQKIWFK
jgi:hypothetical protein